MRNNIIWWIVLIVVIVLGVYFLVVNREPAYEVTPEFEEVSEPQVTPTLPEPTVETALPESQGETPLPLGIQPQAPEGNSQ